ncbi:MAG: insulinase family protein [Clostridiales bacterium]|nr:insulinase family protein [Clostridiales bacterium]
MGKTIYNEHLREELVYHRLKNGLKIYILVKPGYSRQFAIYAARYGSNDSQFVPLGAKEPIVVPDGIAHFLEHKLFEEEEGNVFQEYSGLGAQPNAFTNFNMTAYHFTSTGKFHKCLDVLLGFVGRPYFTDENVEKEKGIIAQEIGMYQDNPYWRTFSNLLKGMYHSYPVKMDIAGTVESISKIDKEILYECYRTFYNPSNMVLFLAGDIDPDRIINQVEKLFDGKPKSKAEGEIERIFPKEKKGVSKHKIVDKLAVSMPMFALGFKDRDVTQGGERLLKKIVANEIILDMLAGPSSETYNELYDEGLIDSSFDTGYTGEVNYGYSVISGQSRDPEGVASVLYEKIKELKYKPWEQEHFDRIRKKKIGEVIRLFNTLDSVSIQFVSMGFKDIALFDYLRGIETAGFEDIIKEFNQLYREDSSTLSVILSN